MSSCQKRLRVPVSCLGSVYINTNVGQFQSSINSFLVGSCLPEQIVVVIDGPIAGKLSEVLCDYSECGIIELVPLEANQGLGPALNYGIEKCSQEIICRFDTDDLNHPDRIRRLYEYLEQSGFGVDIVTSSVLEFDESLIDGACILKKSLATHTEIARRLSIVNAVNHPSVAFRKTSIISVGGYRSIQFFEDYDLWLRCRNAGLRFGGIQYPLVAMSKPLNPARRYGVKYFICEFRFIVLVVRERLVSPQYLPIFFVRLFLRLLPSWLQAFQNYLPWRTPSPVVLAWHRRYLGDA
jgi:glycosyltransferase involved in cell wall biosynthesis